MKTFMSSIEASLSKYAGFVSGARLNLIKLLLDDAPGTAKVGLDIFFSSKRIISILNLSSSIN